MTLTITDAQNYSTKKDGSPILDREGKQKYRSRIKTVEKGDTWLTGFVYRELNAGDVIDAKIEIEEYQGAEQLRFSVIPNKTAQAQATQEKIDERVEKESTLVLLRTISESVQKIERHLITEGHIQAIKKPEEVVQITEEDLGEEFDIFAKDDLPDFGN